MVHACQAMVFSDLALEVEPLPPVARVSGTLTKLSELAEDIVEVTVDSPTFRYASWPVLSLPLSWISGPLVQPHFLAWRSAVRRPHQTSRQAGPRRARNSKPRKHNS